MINMKYLTILAALAGSALAAIPESYEAKLLPGTCEPYGRTMQSGTGWSFAPQVDITPSHTDSEVDGLNPSTKTHTQPMMSPYDYVRFYDARRLVPLNSRVRGFRDEKRKLTRGQFVFKNMTGVARHRIACSDEGALYIATAENSPGLRVFTGVPGHGSLVSGLGLTPDPYGIYVDGEKIDGTFLGLGGVVRWGFKEGDEGVWDARLMVPGEEEEDGAVYGFLQAKTF